MTKEPMVTHKLPRDEVTRTQWGAISNLDWCRREANRINAVGTKVKVRYDKTECWIVRVRE